MRAAVIFGPGASSKDLQPFQKYPEATWQVGLPVNANEADAILIFGGDGTVHRHLAQLVKLHLPVLVVPCGSGNDFARALSLRRVRDSLDAWHRFSSGGSNVRTIDLGVIRPLSTDRRYAGEPAHYFCCVGGVGLDGDIARRANLLPRWLRAHGGYVFSFLPALLRFAPVVLAISVAHPEKRDTFVNRRTRALMVAAFANAPTYGGGMKIAPNAKLDDGNLDVCIIDNTNKFKLCCLFPTVYFGRHLSIRQVEHFRTERLRLESEEPLEVYADGEYICRTPIEVGVWGEAMRVITA